MLAQAETLNAAFWVGTASFFGLSLFSGARRWIRHALLAIPIVLMIAFVALGEWDGVRDYVNWLLGPERMLFFSVMLMVLGMVYYRQWTQPWFIGLLGIVFALIYFGSAADPNFREIISKPDNVPITLMIFLVGLTLWVSFRQMAINDERTARAEPLIEAGSDDKVLTWPDLVYTELIAMVLCSVFLIVWAIFFRAPLEPPANPSAVPNPSKAPWYFLGLQELLVYFDPWIAGVLLPGLIVFGLMALPYIDRNPRGNGYYTLRERPFAIFMFLFGFIVLWVVLIVLGTFLRGPNWNFFGPYEYWDPHLPAALMNVNLSEIFWINILHTGLPTRETAGPYYYLLREAPGLILLGAYFILTPWILKHTLFKNMYAQMGGARYAVMMVLFTWMALVPIKMLLRWLINLKYIVAITEWFFNV
ncbi:MAG: hypothetical protein AMXMBFR13_14340 [Phycisphaerae bacterium]|jgi:hypothetical protein